MVKSQRWRIDQWLQRRYSGKEGEVGECGYKKIT